MNRPSVTIAHSQQTPTIASAPIAHRRVHFARLLEPLLDHVRGGRCVSGAVSGDDHHATTSAAMTR